MLSCLYSLIIVFFSVKNKLTFHGSQVQNIKLKTQGDSKSEEFRSGYDGSCSVDCTVGTPCQYPDQVDLRVIVLTYDRPDSLTKCLTHVYELDTLGDRVSVHIWVDRAVDGHVDNETVRVARQFARRTRPSNWQSCVHVRERNAYIMGQWIDTWRPRPNSSELAIILEDDIDVSPLAYRWLKTIHGHFGSTQDIAGYALQMEDITTKRGKIRPIKGPASDVVYLYAPFCTWGFSPRAEFWRKFQDWFHLTRRHKPDFRPYVPDIISTTWFKQAEREGRPDSVWEMWFNYFCNANKHLTVHPNLRAYTGREDVLLDTNRRERGLHFSGKNRTNADKYLLRRWEPSFEKFPENISRYGFDGELLS